MYDHMVFEMITAETEDAAFDNDVGIAKHLIHDLELQGAAGRDADPELKSQLRDQKQRLGELNAARLRGWLQREECVAD